MNTILIFEFSEFFYQVLKATDPFIQTGIEKGLLRSLFLHYTIPPTTFPSVYVCVCVCVWEGVFTE